MTRPPITSLQNQRVKNAVKLRDQRQRKKQGRFLIDGAREIARALDAGIVPIELFVCEHLCHTPEAQALLERLRPLDAARWDTTREVFAKLAFGRRTEGVLAVAETPRRSLDELALPADPLVAVLEGVEKPGNVGAVVRCADAAGLSAVIVADAATDLYNPNAIRASLGTIFTLPVCAVEADDVRGWLRRGGFRILAARVGAARLYSDTAYDGPTAIVLGSEATGLSAAWRAPDVEDIGLPMLGRADSLNVAATAAVLFYEALRQRTRAAAG